MLLRWCTLAVVMAVVYMVAYTLLRTSGDDRPWLARLRHPKGDRGPAGDGVARSRGPRQRRSGVTWRTGHASGAPGVDPVPKVHRASGR